MTVARIELPPKLIPVFTPPRGSVRTRGSFGGRGSGKTFTFSLMAAVWGYAEPLRILCTREFQSSIKESTHAEVKNAIASIPWLAASYDVGVDYIRGHNGTQFIFKGLQNMSSIKSMSGVDLVFIDEAEIISEVSWRELEPTIRAEKSEVWCTWNPKKENSPIDKRFVKNPPKNAVIAELSYFDNPWFPNVLEEQRKRDMGIMSGAMYRHVWCGNYLKEDESTVFAGKWKIEEFEPTRNWNGPYYGIDWGFSQDPTAGVKAWINEKKLYIEYEAVKVGLELDDTAEFMINRIPGIAQHTIRADCARPESISYVKRKGLPRIIGCQKGKGSVEDGISYMKSFDKIIVHPRCKETQNEMENYCYKVDRLTEDILPIIVDKFNHIIDGIRYSIEPAMRKNRIDYSKLIK